MRRKPKVLLVPTTVYLSPEVRAGLKRRGASVSAFIRDAATRSFKRTKGRKNGA